MPGMKNPYFPIDTVLEDVITETPTIKTLVLKPARPIKFTAGQFMQLTLPGFGEAPFTPSSSPWVTERMDITIMRVGRVTSRLHDLARVLNVPVGYFFSELSEGELPTSTPSVAFMTKIAVSATFMPATTSPMKSG